MTKLIDGHETTQMFLLGLSPNSFIFYLYLHIYSAFNSHTCNVTDHLSSMLDKKVTKKMCQIHRIIGFVG